MTKRASLEKIYSLRDSIFTYKLLFYMCFPRNPPTRCVSAALYIPPLLTRPLAQATEHVLASPSRSTDLTSASTLFPIPAHPPTVAHADPLLCRRARTQSLLRAAATRTRQDPRAPDPQNLRAPVPARPRTRVPQDPPCSGSGHYVTGATVARVHVTGIRGTAGGPILFGG